MSGKYWWLPKLVDFTVTSEATTDYNCFAWALESASQWVDPTAEERYWPEHISRNHTIDSFVELFQWAGYEPCSDGSFEVGFEKIAVYAKEGEPTHAARQLADGQWTSKLGSYEDIVHSSPYDLVGDGLYAYGRVVLFMVRQVTEGVAQAHPLESI